MAGDLIRGRVLATSGDRVVAAQTAYGSGSVTVLGIDPTTGWIAEPTPSRTALAGPDPRALGGGSSA